MIIQLVYSVFDYVNNNYLYREIIGTSAGLSTSDNNHTFRETVFALECSINMYTCSTIKSIAKCQGASVNGDVRICVRIPGLR